MSTVFENISRNIFISLKNLCEMCLNFFSKYVSFSQKLKKNFWDFWKYFFKFPDSFLKISIIF